MVTDPKSTPPPATRSTSASHRGKHELLADYLNRYDFYGGSTSSKGRHEAPTDFASRLPYPEAAPRITKYEHLSETAWVKTGIRRIPER